MRHLVPTLIALLAAPFALAQEPALGPAPAPPLVAYDKGFVLAPKDGFDLRIAGRLQSRWDLLRNLGDGAESAHRFQIARARVTLEGRVFAGTGYKFQTDFGKGFVLMRDFYLDRKLGGMHLRVGQWKRPFSRQQITSSGSLQMVDRSTTDKWIGAGRDIGVALHSNYEKSKPGLEWAVGIFNGTGDGARISCSSELDAMAMEVDTSCKNPSNVPADIGPTLVVHAGWNLGETFKGYSESDLEGGPLRAGFAVSYQVDLAEGNRDAAGNGGDVMDHRVAADFLVKANGVSATGAVYLTKLGEDDVRWSAFAQAGAFVTPRKHEISVRVSHVPNTADPGESDHEILAGFSWFAEGHALKWQTNAGVNYTTTAGARMDVLVLTQAQLVF